MPGVGIGVGIGMGLGLGTGGGRVVPTELMTATFRMAGMTNANSGVTYAQAWAMETSFYAVQAVIANDAAAAYEIEGLSLAPSAKRNDDAHPLTAADAAVPFTRVTFGNGGAFTALADQPANPTAQTLIVPAAVNAQDPVVAASDWVLLSSLARADAGETLPLLFSRYKITAATQGRAVQGLASDDFTNAAKWPAVSQGRMIRCQRRGTNWFTNGNNFNTGTLAEQGLLPILGIRIMSAVRGISVMTLGDSLVMGESTIIEANSWGHRACCLVSTPAKPVTHLALGWSGQTYTNIVARGQRQIDAFRPSILMTFAMSLNGGSNDAAKFTTMRTQFADLVAYAKARGVRVIAVTYPPYRLTGTTETLRTEYNAELRARAAAGEFGLFDYDAVVRDTVDPSVSKTEYRANPGVDEHVNDAGHVAAASDATNGAARALSLVI